MTSNVLNLIIRIIGDSFTKMRKQYYYYCISECNAYKLSKIYVNKIVKQKLNYHNFYY